VARPSCAARESGRTFRSCSAPGGCRIIFQFDLHAHQVGERFFAARILLENPAVEIGSFGKLFQQLQRHGLSKENRLDFGGLEIGDQAQAPLIGFECRTRGAQLQPAEPQAEVRLVAVSIRGECFLKRRGGILPASERLQRSREVKPAGGVFGIKSDKFLIGGDGVLEVFTLVLQITRSGIDFRLMLARRQRLFNARERLLCFALQM
jgi:hypothetical protein